MEALSETVLLRDNMAEVLLAGANRAGAAALYRENLEMLLRAGDSGELTQKELGLLKAAAR